MFFKKIENGKPIGYLITRVNLEVVLLTVDFNAPIDTVKLESLGYAVVEPTPKPKLTPYQTASEFETKNEDGTWLQQWKVEEVSKSERKKIFDSQLKVITDQQNLLLDSYNKLLKDTSLPPEEIPIIQKFISDTKGMDLTDPFNVTWPKVF